MTNILILFLQTGILLRAQVFLLLNLIVGLASRSRKWWKGYLSTALISILPSHKSYVKSILFSSVSQVWSVSKHMIYHVPVCRAIHYLPPAVFWYWSIQIKRPWGSRASCEGDSLYVVNFLFHSANGFLLLLILSIISKQKMLRFYVSKWFSTIYFFFNFDLLF